MYTMTTVRLTILSALFFSFAVGAAVKMNMEPGLWQVSAKDPKTEKMMQSMPPEVRKIMMNSMSVNTCMTKAQIDRGYIGQSQLGGGCKITDVKQVGNQTISKAHCTSPNKADITTTVTHTNSKAFTSVTKTKTAQGDNMIKSTGNWLKSDCGNVKPMTP